MLSSCKLLKCAGLLAALLIACNRASDFPENPDQQQFDLRKYLSAKESKRTTNPEVQSSDVNLNGPIKTKSQRTRFPQNEQTHLDWKKVFGTETDTSKIKTDNNEETPLILPSSQQQSNYEGKSRFPPVHQMEDLNVFSSLQPPTVSTAPQPWTFSPQDSSIKVQFTRKIEEGRETEEKVGFSSTEALLGSPRAFPIKSEEVRFVSPIPQNLHKEDSGQLTKKFQSLKIRSDDVKGLPRQAIFERFEKSTLTSSRGRLARKPDSVIRTTRKDNISYERYDDDVPPKERRKYVREDSSTCESEEESSSDEKENEEKGIKGNGDEDAEQSSSSNDEEEEESSDTDNERTGTRNNRVDEVHPNDSESKKDKHCIDGHSENDSTGTRFPEVKDKASRKNFEGENSLKRRISGGGKDAAEKRMKNDLESLKDPKSGQKKASEKERNDDGTTSENDESDDEKPMQIIEKEKSNTLKTRRTGCCPTRRKMLISAAALGFTLYCYLNPDTIPANINVESLHELGETGMHLLCEGLNSTGTFLADAASDPATFLNNAYQYGGEAATNAGTLLTDAYQYGGQVVQNIGTVAVQISQQCLQAASDAVCGATGPRTLADPPLCRFGGNMGFPSMQYYSSTSSIAASDVCMPPYTFTPGVGCVLPTNYFSVYLFNQSGPACNCYCMPN